MYLRPAKGLMLVKSSLLSPILSMRAPVRSITTLQRNAITFGCLVEGTGSSVVIEMMGNQMTGVDQARRGWLEPSDVISTRPLSELRKLLKR